MNKQEQINKLVEEALNSVDDVQRAEPKPYLFTRINARLNRGTESAWEKMSWLITRPAVAFTGLCFIVLINAMALLYNKSTIQTATTDMAVQNNTDEFSYTVATIYENDNNNP